MLPQGPVPQIQPYIQAPIQQGRISIGNQGVPIQGQGINVIQQRGNFGVTQSYGRNVLINNQMGPSIIMSGSFQSGPQILRN